MTRAVPALRGWYTAIRTTSRALDAIASAGVVVIIIAVVINVYLRMFNGSLAGVIGITELVLAIVVACGFPWALLEGAHVATGLVVDHLAPRPRHLAIRVGRLAAAVIAGWFTYATLDRALTSIQSNELRFGQVEIPVWPGRLSLAIGLAVMTVALVYLTVSGNDGDGQWSGAPDDSVDKAAQT